MTREGVLVRGVHFRDKEGLLLPGRTGKNGGKKTPMVLVRYNPDGEPTTAIARINQRDVELFRNIKAEEQQFKACKDTQHATKEQLGKLADAIKESSRATAEFHSPGAVDNLNNPAPESPMPMEVPTKIKIPSVTSYKKPSK